MKRRSSMLIVIIIIGMSVVNCSHYTPLGEFTVVSTHNVRNLDYEISSEKGVKTTGKSSVTYFFNLRLTSSKDLLQKAMDEAIEKGRKNGVDGDLLVNVRIEHKTTSFFGVQKFIYKVTGDLVKVSKN